LRIGVVTVSQYADVISVLGRSPGDALPGSFEWRQVIIALRLSCRLRGPRDWTRAAKVQGAPPYSVDAQ
jgi:hypothetical protein